MQTHWKRFWTIGLAGAAGWAGLAWAARAEIVYDDSYSSEGTFYQTLFEHGDEVVLAGTARTVVDFRFEYFGDFTPTGNETARVRFYANDGAGPPRFQAPGTLLYDSGPFPMRPGYNTKVLSGLSVTVTNRFTWTVQFGGVLNHVGSRAGLTFFNPPTAGFSFDDYWLNAPDSSTPPNYTWALYHFGDGLVANFAAKVTALPDPSPTIVSQARLTNGLVVLNLTGPVGRDFVLQASTNQVDWLTLSTNTVTSSPMVLLDDHAFVFNPLFYRVLLLPATSIHLLSSTVLTNGNFELQYDGPVGRHVQLEVSTNLVDWQSLGVRTFVGEPVAFVDSGAPGFSNGFYRAVLLTEPPVIIGTNFGLANGQFEMLLNGRPGHDFIMRVSSDVTTWTPISTNTFTFTDGYFDFVDPEATNLATRFYWIVPLP